ncbi:MAG: elongation factor P [Chloroherpetonaceae bacterium]|nr:elongation factor P [Chloroherpetonaceae bacterium]
MATTADLSKGLIIRFNNELHVLEEVIHRTPGNLRAFYQVKMRSIRNGRIVENRFRSGEEVEIVDTERKTFQYLYRDGEDFVLMDNETYDQTNVSSTAFGEASKFLKESMTVEVVYANDGSIVQAEAPNFVELSVTDTSSITKDDRATAGTKPATLETGAVIQVPMFVMVGDVIRVDTRSGAYLDRINNKK